VAGQLLFNYIFNIKIMDIDNKFLYIYLLPFKQDLLFMNVILWDKFHYSVHLDSIRSVETILVILKLPFEQFNTMGN
jgi:hypothetical protein